MKIKEVCEDYIEFDNGNIISVRDSSQIYSYADNYADFNLTRSRIQRALARCRNASN